ncbi:MAG: NAD(P)H-dependent oxidoreductase [Cytophagales bacterium]|nr:NAD(P)H-dependent oxidoreductase [Cytophagales bacterium]
MKILHIIASPRGERSRTLTLAAGFLAALQNRYPDLETEELDLFGANLPEVTGGAVDAKYVVLQGGDPNAEHQVRWDQIKGYANHFLSADLYLISAPMWNFSVPYKLKQYIDIIMQPGLLFRVGPVGLEGLAKNKKMFCITSRGSDYSAGTFMQQFDFMEPYLRSIFGLAGITDVSFINAQPLDYDKKLTETFLQKAVEEANALASSCELAVTEAL